MNSRQLLPSVFQFNNKWASKQATKSTLQGDFESREISYSVDMNYTFENIEDIPQSWKNISYLNMKDESVCDKSTHDTSGTNLLSCLNLSLSK